MDEEQKKNIIRALGLDPSTMSEEEINATLEKMGTAIYQTVLARIVETFTDSDLDEFEKLIEKKAGQEEIVAFLKSKEPNFDEIAKEETEKFARDSKEIMDKL